MSYVVGVRKRNGAQSRSDRSDVDATERVERGVQLTEIKTSSWKYLSNDPSACRNDPICDG